MRKILQTVIDQEKGNCMQAAIASLLDLDLKSVPNFIEHGLEANGMMYDFIKERTGVWPCVVLRGVPASKQEYLATYATLEEMAKHDGGHNGYFYASVLSQTFKHVTHAVIVDTDLRIVHDPNPNQKALDLLPQDVLSILTMRDGWHIDEKGQLIEDK